MIRIHEFDEVLRGNGGPADKYRNDVLFQAYLCSHIFHDEVMNIHTDVKCGDVERIVEFCQRYEMREITISGQMTFVQDVLWRFQELGCIIKGITQLTNDKHMLAPKSAFVIEVPKSEVPYEALLRADLDEGGADVCEIATHRIASATILSPDRVLINYGDIDGSNDGVISAEEFNRRFQIVKRDDEQEETK